MPALFSKNHEALEILRGLGHSVGGGSIQSSGHRPMTFAAIKKLIEALDRLGVDRFARKVFLTTPWEQSREGALSTLKPSSTRLWEKEEQSLLNTFSPEVMRSLIFFQVLKPLWRSQDIWLWAMLRFLLDEVEYLSTLKSGQAVVGKAKVGVAGIDPLAIDREKLDLLIEAGFDPLASDILKLWSQELPNVTSADMTLSEDLDPEGLRSAGLL